MQIRRVSEPFKQLAGKPVKIVSLAEAIAEHSEPKSAICIQEYRLKKQQLQQQRLSTDKQLTIASGQ